MMEQFIFCKIVAGTERSWKVFENERVYAFLDINPVNEFHTLVISRQHYENIFDVPEAELMEIMRVVKKIALLFQVKLGIKHVQIINCSGSEAQQDIFHIHFHIVPRKRGDGQNVRWKTHPEWVAKFDQILERLGE